MLQEFEDFVWKASSKKCIKKVCCIKYISFKLSCKKQKIITLSWKLEWNEHQKGCKDLKATQPISVSSPALFPGLPNATRVPTDPWRPGRRSSNESVSWRRFQWEEKGVSRDDWVVSCGFQPCAPWHLDGVLGWDSWGILGKGYIQLSSEGK